MLVDCPECKNQVSNEATSCPKCGHKLKDTYSEDTLKKFGWFALGAAIAYWGLHILRLNALR